MAPIRGPREALFEYVPMMRRLAWFGAALAVVAAIVVAMLVLKPHGANGDGEVAIGGPFSLVNQSGAAVDQHVLDGKWSAVFFGYTYCPDVCPTTLTALGRAVDALGPDGRRFQVVFITVDPDRDTPHAMATYLSSATFPKAAIGLTGSPAQIATVAKAYRVLYQKHVDGDTYTMDHSAVVYLMDPHGRFVSPLDVTAPTPDLVRQIRQAMHAS
jgi:protein SCO1/2